MKRMLWVCLLVFAFIFNWSLVFAADVYVESSGSCGGKSPCYSTIQAAINAANSGDTIKLAEGIYAETFVLNSDKQLILQGGWDVGFTKQTPRTTVIRAPIVTKGSITFQEVVIMEITWPFGNANTADVLDGKTFSSDAGTGLTGTMPNQGGLSYTPTTTDQTIVAGYYNGSGKVVGDSNLVPGNIRSGVTIFGVAGNSNVVDTSTGDAVSGEIMKDKKAWVDGNEVTGTLATQTLSPDSTTVTAGNYAATTLNAVDPDLAPANIVSGKTIFGKAGSAVVATGDAVKADVLATKTFSNSSAAGLTGTMPIREGDNASTAQGESGGDNYFTAPEGYYDGDDRVSATDAQVAALDTDISADNIKCGETIFGVTGTLSYEIECIAKTGQTTSYAAGDDGAYQKGCDPAVVPSGSFNFGNYNRNSFPCSAGFTDNGNGTVTDNLTGLVWLKNANCFGPRDWATALNACNTLEDLDPACSLTDGSSAGDWRLPNVNELRSLFDPTLASPYLPVGHPFTGVQSSYYWSSSTYAGNTSFAWDVDLVGGYVTYDAKSYAGYVWPVRSGN